MGEWEEPESCALTPRALIWRSTERRRGQVQGNSQTAAFACSTASMAAGKIIFKWVWRWRVEAQTIYRLSDSGLGLTNPCGSNEGFPLTTRSPSSTLELMCLEQISNGSCEYKRLPPGKTCSNWEPPSYSTGDNGIRGSPHVWITAVTNGGDNEDQSRMRKPHIVGKWSTCRLMVLALISINKCVFMNYRLMHFVWCQILKVTLRFVKHLIEKTNNV